MRAAKCAAGKNAGIIDLDIRRRITAESADIEGGGNRCYRERDAEKSREKLLHTSITQAAQP